MILDGWGIGNHGKADVIFNTPYSLLGLFSKNLSQFTTSDQWRKCAGLPMVKWEILRSVTSTSAGRVVYRDLVKINLACRDNSIMQNPGVVAAFTYAKENGKIFISWG